MRDFTPTQIVGPEHKLLRGFKITCGKCGTEFKAPVNSNSTAGIGGDDGKMHALAARKFVKEGWYIGKRECDDRCPQHYREALMAKTKREGDVSAADEVKEVPQEMGREDRRIIFEKLNSIYVDDKVGYSADWTDKKVAEDLGIPRAWVEKVRDEMFGPAGNNEKITAGVADALKVLESAATVLKHVEETKKSLSRLISEIDIKIAPVNALLDKTQRTLAELQKSVR